MHQIINHPQPYSMAHSILQDGQLTIENIMFNNIPGWIWITAAVIIGVVTTGSMATYAKRHVLFTAGKSLFQ
jgi:hypothetical protein